MKMIAEIGAGVLLLEMPASSDERGSFIKLADFRLDEIRRFEHPVMSAAALLNLPIFV
jgi:hypothetical protein